MNTRKIDQAEASEINLTKKYGIMGDNCISIWGEGDTLDEAIRAAGENQADVLHGKTDFDDCEIVELA
jgi:hypothetical protein